jgi:predicted AlkP superfamily phosphohydrolase/phosphomutase
LRRTDADARPSHEGRVLLVLLDAAEVDLLEPLADQGVLPALAELRRSALAFRPANRLDLIPDSLWPELHAGRHVAKTGLYNALSNLRTGQAIVEPISQEELDRRDCWWTWADRAGKRAVVIDPIEGGLDPELDAWQVQGFSVHHHVGSARESPVDPLSAIVRRTGRDVAGPCQRYGPSHSGHLALLDDLISGIARKTALTVELLGATDWDYFCVTYTQAHCVGHELWHLHDEGHPLHDPKAPERLRSAVRTVYTELDRALGRILQAAGEETTVLVLANPGMTRLGGAENLLPELLEALGLGVGGRGRMQWAARLPLWAKRLGRRVLSQRFLDRHRVGYYTRISGFHGARAMALMNNRTGGIRLNLAGRDLEGLVQPGAEADGLLARIEQAAGELVDERTGERLLERATRISDAFGADHHPDLPDLFLEFRQDLGPIDAALSPRLGRLVCPKLSYRTGDHTAHSALWIRRPASAAPIAGTPSGEPAGVPVDCDLLDIAPTVLALGGVEPPAVMDGRPLF